MPLSFYRLWSVSGRCTELAGRPSLGRNTTTNVCNILGSVPQNMFFLFVIRDTFNLISFSFVFCIKIISPILSQNILFSIHKEIEANS